MRKLRIGITGNILIMDGGMLPGIYRSYVNNDYVESLEQAGCIPVLLPVISNLNDVKEQMEGLDGIVLSGDTISIRHCMGSSPCRDRDLQ